MALNKLLDKLTVLLKFDQVETSFGFRKNFMDQCISQGQ